LASTADRQWCQARAIPQARTFHDGFAMTLWPHVEHQGVDYKDSEQIASAARALRTVHEALADLPHSQPSYLRKIEECGSLLANRSELSALPRWTDFEPVSIGPREWDICWVPGLAMFEPIDRECYEVLSLVRRLCVSTWCWALPHLPGKLEAANYHLNYLRSRTLPDLSGLGREQRQSSLAFALISEPQ
jgi:hypothetical protein